MPAIAVPAFRGATVRAGSRKLRPAASQSARIPASLTTLPHMAMSDFIRATSSAGVDPAISEPAVADRSFTSGRFRTRAVSWLRRLMIAPGGLPGAKSATPATCT